MKIKSTIVVAAAAGSALAPNAQAADMPVKGPKMTPAPAWSWTGFYVGAHLGYAWQRSPTSGAYADGADIHRFDYASQPRGFVGGGQIGYNWQVGRLVFGAEADISRLSGSGVASTILDDDEASVTTQNRIRWMGTIRGRLGVTVLPRTMIYGTGGFAYGKVKFDHLGVEDDADDVANWRYNKIKTGYVAGGGIEHAVLDNVTVRVEGLYVDLGTTTLATPNTGTCDTACQPVTFSNKATIIRGGVNLKF